MREEGGREREGGRKSANEWRVSNDDEKQHTRRPNKSLAKKWRVLAMVVMLVDVDGLGRVAKREST